MSENLQEIYKQNSNFVRATGFDEASATAAYKKYVEFVNFSAKVKGKLLDVGCGSGWSSYIFSQHGYNVTGIDLNVNAFECPTSSLLKLFEASVLHLPFMDSSFDIVASNQAIEHVPDPERALKEMIRVLRPGGILCIVAPNLLSLGQFIASISRYVWLKPSLKDVFVRTDDMPKHPWGNTLPEVFISFPFKLSLILKKSFSRNPSFTMREPDLNPPFHADNDACYLCNPIDLVKFLPTQNCNIIKNGFYGRPPLTTMLASGTFIAARKRTP
jgi:SAM-dependent methyltransferase